MLEARKSVWLEEIFAVYNRNLFKRRFHSLRVSGLEFLSERDKKLPLLIYANHSSWWDGLVGFEISRLSKLDSFYMMEEKQLRNLSFFRRLGAFSVVREKPREAVKSLEYSVKILGENPNRAVWIFPQGEILPNDVRPLCFYNGAAKIIEKLDNCRTIPVAMRYEFFGEFKPEIFVKIGTSEVVKKTKGVSSKETTRLLEEKLTETLNELRTEISIKKVENYQKIF